MKKNLPAFFSFIMLISLSLHAQVNYKINENTWQKVSISFSFGEIQTTVIETESGTFSRIFIDGCGKSNSIGNPELPVSVNMLEIPICSDYVLNVYGKEFVTFNATALEINHPVYPAQPSVSKSHKGSVMFLKNEETYQTDAFYTLPLAKFEVAGIMRHVNLGELYLSPVQYNPVTNEIKFYKTIDVEILFKKTELVKTQVIKNLHESPLFYPFNVINSIPKSRAELSNTPIKYLIVSDSTFRGELDSFILWKKRKGFLVEIGYTDEENVGTTTASIAQFIKSHYEEATSENPAPTFVLLVGDVQQIPAFQGTASYHSTDLYYFTTGTGYLPWCYYGRFSAQKLHQLTPQIEKTLQYENFSMPDPNYLNDAVLIAGYDAGYAPKYANGQLNYTAQNYVNTSNGYAKVFLHKHPCSNQAEQIRAEIGAGVGLANYSAHGSPNGWSLPAFNISHIDNMKNENKYGLMIGNCCESNKFNELECFGEALLRAPKKGAVGYIGASNDTYWDEDYYWAIGLRSKIDSNPIYDPENLGAYDRLFHTNGEGYSQWMTTFGAMIAAGNATLTLSNSTLKKYYREVYHLMGDPSVMTYLAKPSRMTVEINNVIPFGDSTLYAKVAPYAYCALTDSACELISAGFADATGNITLTFPPMDVHHTYEFTAWAQKYIQYFKTVFSGYLGIEEVPITNYEVQVYPNPTTGELQITNLPRWRGQGVETLQIMGVDVFDVYGNQLSFNHLISSSPHHKIDISHLPSGIYFLKIKTDRTVITKKIVKN